MVRITMGEQEEEDEEGDNDEEEDEEDAMRLTPVILGYETYNLSYNHHK